MAFIKSGSSVTVLTVAVFCWYISNNVHRVFMMFYPTYHFPYFTDPPPAPFHQQLWPENRKFSLFLYSSAKDSPRALFTPSPKGLPAPKPIWEVPDLEQAFENKEEVVDIRFPKKTRNNGTLYLHAFVTEAGKSPDPTSKLHDPMMLYAFTPLTKHLQIVTNSTRSLLSDEESKDPNELAPEDQPIVTHWKEFVQLEIVFDRSQYPKYRIPNDILQRLRLVGNDKKFYLPMFYFNEIGLRRDHMKPFNLTKPALSAGVKLGFRSASLGMSRVHLQFENSFAMLQSSDSPIRVSEKEIDNMRQMFFEVAPSLLALTFLAAFLHMLFDFLAFKSDVSHWRSKESLAGTSKSSIAFTAVANTLSFFYLLDKRKETSALVLIGAASTAIVEYYKVFCVLRLRSVSAANPNKTKHQIEAEAEASEVDQIVFKYTLILSVPIAMTYGAYTLMYEKYSSFYSWGLEAVMALVYLLGFINMIPQVFINYRIKSVESIALGTFFFRAINTFVDDLFTFVIPMPMLARLAAFRDDIIFFVFLYQWYVYPSRPATDEDEETDEKKNQ